MLVTIDNKRYQVRVASDGSVEYAPGSFNSADNEWVYRDDNWSRMPDTLLGEWRSKNRSFSDWVQTNAPKAMTPTATAAQETTAGLANVEKFWGGALEASAKNLNTAIESLNRAEADYQAILKGLEGQTVQGKPKVPTAEQVEAYNKAKADAQKAILAAGEAHLENQQKYATALTNAQVSGPEVERRTQQSELLRLQIATTNRALELAKATTQDEIARSAAALSTAQNNALTAANQAISTAASAAEAGVLARIGTQNAQLNYDVSKYNFDLTKKLEPYVTARAAAGARQSTAEADYAARSVNDRLVILSTQVTSDKLKAELLELARDVEKTPEVKRARVQEIVANAARLGYAADAQRLDNALKELTLAASPELIQQSIQKGAAELERLQLQNRDLRESMDASTPEEKRRQVLATIEANEANVARLKQQLQFFADMHPLEMERAGVDIEAIRTNTWASKEGVAERRQGALYGIQDKIAEIRKIVFGPGGSHSEDDANELLDRWVAAEMAGTTVFEAEKAREGIITDRLGIEERQRADDAAFERDRMSQYFGANAQDLAKFSGMNPTVGIGSESAGRAYLASRRMNMRDVRAFETPERIAMPEVPDFLRSMMPGVNWAAANAAGQAAAAPAAAAPASAAPAAAPVSVVINAAPAGAGAPNTMFPNMVTPAGVPGSGYTPSPIPFEGNYPAPAFMQGRPLSSPISQPEPATTALVDQWEQEEAAAGAARFGGMMQN